MFLSINVTSRQEVNLKKLRSDAQICYAVGWSRKAANLLSQKYLMMTGFIYTKRDLTSVPLDQKTGNDVTAASSLHVHGNICVTSKPPLKTKDSSIWNSVNNKMHVPVYDKHETNRMPLMSLSED